MIAYTDPGTGALIWQVLIASSVSVLFFSKKILLYIKTMFTKKRPHDPS